MSRSRAAIFDLDGTLVDNMRFHARAWVEIARTLGLSIGDDHFISQTAGQKNSEILAELLGRPVDMDEVERLSEQKETVYRDLYCPHVREVRGLSPLLVRLDAAGFGLGIATLAPLVNRSMVLNALGLGPYFQSIIGGEETPRGKPAPDIYLAAAAALGVAPRDCVAFEDAPNGVVSARDAGMKVVGVATQTASSLLSAAGARWIVRNYEDLPADLESHLFGAS